MNALIALDLSLLQSRLALAQRVVMKSPLVYTRKKSPLETDQFRGRKRNHESRTKNTKHVRIMNLCFKNLGITNLCISARESWKTRLWEKLKKILVWINCVRSRECRIWRFRGSNFQIFSGGTRTHYLIRAFGATPCQDNTNDDTKSEWSRSLNTKEYKTRLP